MRMIFTAALWVKVAPADERTTERRGVPATRAGGLARAIFVALWLSSPVSAHHPGADLDKVVGDKERYFQAIDKPAPAFELFDAGGNKVALADFSGKVAVLHFVYAGCPDVCPLHAEQLADVQQKINGTAMKDLVRFVTITTDPKNDTPDVLKTYGPNHGLDPVNWTFLTIGPHQDEGSTRALAEAFGHSFIRRAGGYQLHGVVTHVIDRDGRWAANFHGLRFDPVNMVLYINGLINDTREPAAKGKQGLWDKLKGLME